MTLWDSGAVASWLIVIGVLLNGSVEENITVTVLEVRLWSLWRHANETLETWIVSYGQVTSLSHSPQLVVWFWVVHASRRFIFILATSDPIHSNIGFSGNLTHKVPASLLTRFIRPKQLILLGAELFSAARHSALAIPQQGYHPLPTILLLYSGLGTDVEFQRWQWRLRSMTSQGKESMKT